MNREEYENFILELKKTFPFTFLFGIGFLIIGALVAERNFEYFNLLLQGLITGSLIDLIRQLSKNNN